MRILLHRRHGFLLIEILLGIAVFAIFLGGVGLSLMYGQTQTEDAGDSERAIALAQTALEVARNYGVTDFSALTEGDHGIRLDTGSGRWVFSGTSSTHSGYILVLTFGPNVGGKVLATAKVAWSILPNRPRSLSLSTQLTKYVPARAVGKWSAAALTGSCVAGACGTLAGNPLFNDIAIKGKYVYVGSEVSTGGAGLYLFDVTNVRSPAFVKSFSLGAAVYDLGIKGSTLYMVMARSDSEVRAYDIIDPLSPKLLDAYNFPGTGSATSLSIDGNVLYVGGKGISSAAGASSAGASSSAPAGASSPMGGRLGPPLVPWGRRVAGLFPFPSLKSTAASGQSSGKAASDKRQAASIDGSAYSSSLIAYRFSGLSSLLQHWVRPYAAAAACWQFDDDGQPIPCSGPVCGNGTVETGEQCDDGNTRGSDGCSSTCKTEVDCTGTRISVGYPYDGRVITENEQCPPTCHECRKQCETGTAHYIAYGNGVYTQCESLSGLPGSCRDEGEENNVTCKPPGGASSASSTGPLACFSTALNVNNYVPTSVTANGATVKCVEDCVATNPRLHGTTCYGNSYPYCVRAPASSTIASETETQYLTNHLFWQGPDPNKYYNWNSTDTCDGQCSPAPQVTLPLCDAGVSPFSHLNGKWMPNCSNGVCQEPRFTLNDVGNTSVLCPPDVRMTQCALANDRTAYAFLPDGSKCDTDSQCYRGSNRVGWRPYASQCVTKETFDTAGNLTTQKVCVPPDVYAGGGGPNTNNAVSCQGDPCLPDPDICSPYTCFYDASEPLCYRCQSGDGTPSCRDLNQPCTPGGGSDACCSPNVCEGVCKAPGGGGSGSNDDFFSFDISDRTKIIYLDSIWVGGVNKIALTGTAAYLASPKNDGELIVADIAKPSDLKKKGEYNMGDRTLDGLSVATTGTSAVLGTQRGASIQEFALFTDIKNRPVPSAVAGYHEGSGSIVALDADPTGCYAFYADQWDQKGLQILKLKGALPELYSYLSTARDPNGPGRGIHYQVERDRLYLTANKALYIFTPASPPNDCQ